MKLMTVREAAQRLEIDESTVYALVSSGKLRARRISIKGRRGTIRITEDALAAFVLVAEQEAVTDRPADDCEGPETDPEMLAYFRQRYL